MKNQISNDDAKKWMEKNSDINLISNFFDNLDRTYIKDNQIKLTDLSLSIDVSKYPADADFEIYTSGLLQPEGNIPPLYINIGGHRQIIPNKELSFNHFLLETFITLIPFRIDSFKGKHDAIIYTETFIHENKDKIQSITTGFEMRPHRLGSGVDGVAWAIGPNKVLKIFTSEFGYDASIKAIKRLHENPELAKTEAMLYDVGFIGELLGHKIFYYIIELMKPVPNLRGSEVTQGLKKIVGMIYRIIINNKELWKNIKENLDEEIQNKTLMGKINNFTNIVQKDIEYRYNDLIFKIEKELDLKPGWLPLFIQEVLMKLVTKRGDLHLGNLGVTNYGELRYFDPAHEEFTSNLHPSMY